MVTLVLFFSAIRTHEPRWAWSSWCCRAWCSSENDPGRAESHCRRIADLHLHRSVSHMSIKQIESTFVFCCIAVAHPEGNPCFIIVGYTTNAESTNTKVARTPVACSRSYVTERPTMAMCLLDYGHAYFLLELQLVYSDDSWIAKVDRMEIASTGISFWMVSYGRMLIVVILSVFWQYKVIILEVDCHFICSLACVTI